MCLALWSHAVHACPLPAISILWIYLYPYTSLHVYHNKSTVIMIEKDLPKIAKQKNNRNGHLYESLVL